MLKIADAKKSKDLGFTLIELIVVISIIGILAGLVLVSMLGARSKARDVRRKTDAIQIMKALEFYYSDNGNYPVSGGAILPNNGWSTSNDGSWDTLTTRLSPYITLPKDPVNDGSGWPGGGQYDYSYYSLNYGCGQQWYMFVYKLENPGTASPGVKTCSGTNINYTGTITAGMCQGCR